MRRKLLAVLLSAGMLAGVFAGCGQSSGTGQSDPGSGQVASVQEEQQEEKKENEIPVILPDE